MVRYLSLLGTCRQAGEGVITSTWAAAQMLVPQPLRSYYFDHSWGGCSGDAQDTAGELRSSTTQYHRCEKQRRNDDAGDQQARGC